MEWNWKLSLTKVEFRLGETLLPTIASNFEIIVGPFDKVFLMQSPTLLPTYLYLYVWMYVSGLFI